MTKKGEKGEKMAIIMAGRQKDVLTAAVIVLKESLLGEFPNFDPEEDCFIILNTNLSNLKVDLSEYKKVLVIDPDNKFLNLENFIIKNSSSSRRFFWYLGQSSLIPAMQNFFGENNVHICNENYFYSKAMPLGNYELRLVRAISSLRRGVNDACPETQRITQAIYMAKVKDGKISSGPVYLERTLKELFFELVVKNKSQVINTLIIQLKILKEAEKMAKRTKIEHPVLGKLKIVKPPKGSMVENTTFFEQGFNLGYNAVAVKSVTKGEYELCLKKNLAKKLINEIPAIERINGCRFIVSKEFLIQEPEIK